MWCRIHKGWAEWLTAVSEDAVALETEYQKLYNRLLSDNVEFDYGDEEMLARLGRVENGILYLGKAKYTCVIVSGMTTMRSSTYAMLQELQRQGGKVIVLGKAPEYIDALPAQVSLGNGSYDDILKKRIVWAEPEKIFSSIKTDADGNIYIMLLNMDSTNVSQGILTAPEGQYTQYFPENGESMSVEKPKSILLHPGEMRLYQIENCKIPEKTEINTSTSDAGTQQTEAAIPQADEKVQPAGTALPQIYLTASFHYETDEPNVLVLDRAQCCYQGQTMEDEILRLDNRLRDVCGIEQRGGNMYQPWYQKQLGIRQYFPITLTYRFQSDIETDAWLAMEQAERCHVQLNGKEIHTNHTWWIDSCMEKFDIHVQKGENVLTVNTVFADDTDLEAVYILGEFGVYNGKIRKKPEQISLGDITTQGFPFYSGTFRYVFHQKIEERSLLKLPGLCGAACVRVNGKIIAWMPYEVLLEPCDTLTVELYLTRRNTFGPFHLYPPAKETSPRSYVTTGEQWTDEMLVIPCGLPEEL